MTHISYLPRWAHAKLKMPSAYTPPTHRIEWVATFNVLDVIIDNTLSFRIHNNKFCANQIFDALHWICCDPDV